MDLRRWPASAVTREVLPVPGGPYRRYPRRQGMPCAAAAHDPTVEVGHSGSGHCLTRMRSRMTPATGWTKAAAAELQDNDITGVRKSFWCNAKTGPNIQVQMRISEQVSYPDLQVRHVRGSPYQASEAWNCSASATTDAICACGRMTDDSGRMGRLPTCRHAEGFRQTFVS